ncbi:hypothetical protein LJR034_008548 [Caballeronia sp. LjRoot34]|uniref:hypothetical protein n=1 Tax=Caballeronia sp. LjRoot34 TaxID=3342325 RepID=UPI003ECF402A
MATLDVLMINAHEHDCRFMNMKNHSSATTRMLYKRSDLCGRAKWIAKNLRMKSSQQHTFWEKLSIFVFQARSYIVEFAIRVAFALLTLRS